MTENLYGDIISDVAAEVSGSVGLAGSSNIGSNFAMFEAIHGSAPDISGKDIANPSGLLNGAIMMLVHIGQHDVATLVHNAWLASLESGIHTADIFGAQSQEKCGTQDFAKVVIAHLGERPKSLKAVDYKPMATVATKPKDISIVDAAKRELVGVDVFVYSTGEVDKLGDSLKGLAGDALTLHSISSKGLKLWPNYVPGMNVTDQFNCRFKKSGASVSPKDISELTARLAAKNIDFVKTENLYEFGGKAGYSLGQGE